MKILLFSQREYNEVSYVISSTSQQCSEGNSPFTVDNGVLALGPELLGHATPNPMLLHSHDQRQTTPF